MCIRNVVEEDLFNDSYNVMTESFEELERQNDLEIIQNAIRQRLAELLGPEEREEDLFNDSYNVMTQSFVELNREIERENQQQRSMLRSNAEEDLFNDSYNVMSQSFEELYQEEMKENQNRCQPCQKNQSYRDLLLQTVSERESEQSL